MQRTSPFINPWNRAFVALKNLLPSRTGATPISRSAIERIQEHVTLLDSCRTMYDSRALFRQDREINRKYYFNDQFCELIPDPDNPSSMISEKDYLIRQGMIPLSINLIRVNNKAIEGLFTQDKMDPLVKSRIREEQKIGEMMTMVMKYIYQSQNLYGVCARGYEEFLISSLPAFRTGYRWDENRKEKDVFVERCDINRMFWDDNIGTSEQYFSNVSTIGYLHDMTMSDVLKFFSHSPADSDKIQQAYSECRDKYPVQQYQQHQPNEVIGISFYTPKETHKCRVIEVWTKESHEVWACHDLSTGEAYTLPCTSAARAEIEAVNAKRKEQMLAAGGNPDQSPLIEYEYRVDTDWVVRYLTPNGYLLRQEIPEYLHGSHPFVIGAFPLVDGQVCSAVKDQRNAQRMVNRTFIRSEFMEMNRAKGFKWVNKIILDRSGLTIDQFSNQYSSANGLAALEVHEGEEKIVMGPTDVNNGYSAEADMNKIRFFADVMDRVSGTPGSVRGERPTSGTPSSLYAQQTQNANNNLADPLEWYNGLIQVLDFKVMMLILQYYDKERYLRIVGDDYVKEIDYIIDSDQRDILCDVALIKSPSNGVARAETESMLINMLNAGAITPEDYLDTTSTHGADKLLEKIEARKKEQEEAQRNQQLNGGAPTVPGTPAAPAVPGGAPATPVQ